MPEVKKTVRARLAEAALEIGSLEKDGRNSQQGYEYVTAANAITKANRAIASRGLVPDVESFLDSYNVSTTKGTPTTAVVKVRLTFRDGEDVVMAEGQSEGRDHGDKAINKANTGAYKYALSQLLMLGFNAEDSEADERTDRDAKEEPAKRPATRKKAAEKPPELTPDEAQALAYIAAEEICAARDLEQLKATRPKVKALREKVPKEAYDKLVALYLGTEKALAPAKEGEKE